MTKQPSATIRKDLKESFRELDLGSVFFGISGTVTKSVPRRYIERELITHADTSRVEDEQGFIDPTYEDEIIQSLDSYFEDCINCGVLEKTDTGQLRMVMLDPNLMMSERDGFRVELNRTHPYTVYRKRMNTSGQMDTKANGDYAIDGVTAESALSW